MVCPLTPKFKGCAGIPKKSLKIVGLGCLTDPPRNSSRPRGYPVCATLVHKAWRALWGRRGTLWARLPADFFTASEGAVASFAAQRTRRVHLERAARGNIRGGQGERDHQSGDRAEGGRIGRLGAVELRRDQARQRPGAGQPEERADRNQHQRVADRAGGVRKVGAASGGAGPRSRPARGAFLLKPTSGRGASPGGECSRAR